MRALFSQRGGKPGEVLAQKRDKKTKKQEVVAKVEGITYPLPSPEELASEAFFGKRTEKRTDTDGNEHEYTGLHAVALAVFESDLNSALGDLRKGAVKGKGFDAAEVQKAIDSYDPNAPRTRKTTAESVAEAWASQGVDLSDEKVQKLLAMLQK